MILLIASDVFPVPVIYDVGECKFCFLSKADVNSQIDIATNPSAVKAPSFVKFIIGTHWSIRIFLKCTTHVGVVSIARIGKEVKLAYPVVETGICAIAIKLTA